MYEVGMFQRLPESLDSLTRSFLGRLRPALAKVTAEYNDVQSAGTRLTARTVPNKILPPVAKDFGWSKATRLEIRRGCGTAPGEVVGDFIDQGVM